MPAIPSFHPYRPLAAALLAAALSASASTPADRPASDANHAQIAQTYGKLPLSFEANLGQSNPRVKFLSRGNGYSLFLTNRSAVLALTKATGSKATGSSPYARAGNLGGAGRDGLPPIRTPEAKPQTDTIVMQLANANPNAKIEGADQLPGHANYFLGNDPAKWHTNVPTYAKVRYTNVYDGIDLVYYGNQRQLEYDFIVQPGSNPQAIQLHFAGAQKLKLAPNGDLEVLGKNGQIAFHKPVLYQLKDGQRQPVQGRFVLEANNQVGFEIGNYDRSRALVIDPVLAYSTYLGDSTFLGFSQGTWATAIAVDSSGFAYVTGYVYPNDFPLTTSPFQSVNKEQPHKNPTGFVTKLSQDGKSLIYSTYIGGSEDTQSTRYPFDQPAAIAVDASGSAYICGITGASDFPVTSGAFLASNPGLANNQSSPFVTKFSVDGAKLEYSTFLGGSGLQGGLPDVASGIAIDSAGDAYIVGTTYSTDFPVKNPFQSTNLAQPNQSGPGSNAFVSKLNPTGTALVWSTYLGGEGNGNCDGDGASSIAVDSSDNAYVAGETCSTDFPVAGNPFQPKYLANANLTPEAFITEFEPAGNKLVYSTYLGGTGIPNTPGNLNTGDGATGIAIDGSGDVFVTGFTYSTNFPVTPGSYQPANHAVSAQGANAFVTELNPTGSALKYSTYLGGSRLEIGWGIAIDPDGDAYVFGQSYSKDFPVTSKTAFQSTTPESTAIATFLTEFNSAGTSLVYSTYFGGSGALAGDLAAGMVLDSDGGIYLTGNTGSQAFPTTVGAFQTVNENPGFPAGSAFVSKFYSGTAATLNRATTLQVTASPTSPAYGTKVTFTASVSPSSGAGNPTGTVAFSVWGGPPTVVAVDSTGHASFSSSTLVPPEASVTASYSGDAIFQGSNALSGVQISGSAPATYLTGVNSGSQQISPVGTPFGNPLAVLVGTYAGQPASGVTVTFSGTGLKFSPTSVKTNSSGIASVTATPTLAGNLVATATVTGQLSPAYFDLAGVNSTGSSPTATPTLSPAAGTYTSPVTVTVSDGTPSAAIYCTTNGTTPTPSSPKYNGPITVSSTETIECIATATGFTESAVATARYAIQIPASIAVSSGSGQTAAYGTLYALPLTVIVKDANGDTVPGATVTFTGTGLKFSSATATTNAAGVASVTATPTAVGTLTAKAAVAGVATPATFTETAAKAALTVTATSVSVAYNAAIPTLAYTITGYANGDTAAVVTGKPTETTTALKGSQPGTYPITLGAGTLAATNYTFKLVNGTVTITALGVTAEPAGTESIAIAEATSGATVYYTTNGSTPTTASTVYKGPISVTATTTIKFIAVAPGYTPSAVRTIVVTVD